MKIKTVMLSAIFVVMHVHGAARCAATNKTMVIIEYGHYDSYIRHVDDDNTEAWIELRDDLSNYIARPDVRPVLEDDVELKSGFEIMLGRIHAKIPPPIALRQRLYGDLLNEDEEN